MFRHYIRTDTFFSLSLSRVAGLYNLLFQFVTQLGNSKSLLKNSARE